MSEWTDARIAFLRKRWGEGATASQIARELNEKFGGYVSRNAVIGKASRIGLIGRPNPIRSRNPEATAEKHKAAARLPRKANRDEGARAVIDARQRTAAPLAQVAVKPTPRSFPVPLKASPFRTCQYLHGEAKLRNFCGAPTVLGHSWCEAHYIACHEKQKLVERPESEAA